MGGENNCTSRRKPFDKPKLQEDDTSIEIHFSTGKEAKMLKSYESKQVANMQAGSKTKKTGVRHLVEQVNGLFFVGTFEEISEYIASPMEAVKPSEKNRVKDRQISVMGKFVRETKCFVCLSKDGEDLWFNKGTVDSYAVSGDLVEVIVSEQYKYHKKSLKAA